MGKNQEKQRLLRAYRDQTGEKEVDMRDVARFAVRMGMKLPDPIDPIDRLAKQFSLAARQETRVDKVTGRPYRANHAWPTMKDGEQTHLWVDMDEAPRDRMFPSLQNRREQMVGDAVQLTFDAEHWNRMNPDQEPIVIELDFGPDVEWRRNTPEDKAS